MGCGASSTVSTSVLEPQQVDEMRDTTPHRSVAPVAEPQQAPLRVIRTRPDNYEKMERRAGIKSHRATSPNKAIPLTPAPAPQEPVELCIESDLSKGTGGAALESLFSPRQPSGRSHNTDRAQPLGRSTRSSGNTHVVQPRRYSAQRRAIALHAHSHNRLAEQEENTGHKQPYVPPATVVQVSELRGKQPQVVRSNYDGEGFLPGKLPPIRRTWMTNLGDLPPIEKTSPRQLALGLARARDEAVQIAAAANAEESRARIRAENFAWRNASVESAEELRASLAMFTELREQNDVALASLSTGTQSRSKAVHDDVEMVQFSAGVSTLSGNASWSCGTASLDLDMLELSTSSLSLSQELEHSSAQNAQRCEPIPNGLAAAKAQ